MKAQSTLLYAAVTLALFSFIFFYERNAKTTDERNLSEKKLFTGIKSDEIQHLEIQQGAQSVVLEKKNQKWRVEKPLSLETEEVELNQVLSELEFAEVQRVITAAEWNGASATDSLKLMGLAEPALHVTFVAAQKSYDLWVGRKVPTRESYYARTVADAQSPVLLLSGQTYQALNKSLNNLRSRSVFSGTVKDVTRVGLRLSAVDGQPPREVEAALKEGRWSLQKPLMARADAQKVSTWLTQALGLRVAQFIADDTSDGGTYGLSNPTRQIWFQAGPQNEETTLVLGADVPGQAGEVYAKRLKNNAVFTLQQSQLKPLLEGLNDIRDKRVLAFDVGPINHVRVENRGKVIVAKLQDGTWQLDGEKTFTADSGTLTAFLAKLQNLAATSFVKDTTSDLKSFGLENPPVKIVLGKNNSAEALELWLGKLDKKVVYAKNSTESFVVGLDAQLLDELPKENFNWRDLRAITADVNQVKALTIVTRDGSTTTIQRKGPGQYVTDLAQRTINAPMADAQISLLSQLRAVRWLGAATPALGLNRPQLKFTLGLETPVTVKVGSQLPSGNYAAQLEGQDMAFEVSLSDFDLLDKMPVNSVVTAPNPTTSH